MIYSSRTSSGDSANTKRPSFLNDPNRFIRGSGGEQMKQRAAELVAKTEAEKPKRQEWRETERTRTVNSVTMTSTPTHNYKTTTTALSSPSNNLILNDELDTAGLLEQWHAKRRQKEEQQQKEKERQAFDDDTAPVIALSLGSSSSSNSGTSPSAVLKPLRRPVDGSS